MSSDELRPVYLLLGSDRPKIRRALARLRERFADRTIELLSADTTTGEDAVAACNALGLFGAGGATLVVVDGVERWKAEDADAVAAYLANPSPDSVLALVAEGALKQAGLVAACEHAGQVLDYDVPKPRDPSGWVRSEFERLGVRRTRMPPARSSRSSATTCPSSNRNREARDVGRGGARGPA